MSDLDLLDFDKALFELVSKRVDKEFSALAEKGKDFFLSNFSSLQVRFMSAINGVLESAVLDSTNMLVRICRTEDQHGKITFFDMKEDNKS